MFTKTFKCGCVVTVTDYTVSFDGSNPSNVDYYRQEGRGYGCGDDDEAVANQYHANFCPSGDLPDDDIPEEIWDVDGAGTTGFNGGQSNRAF